MFIDIKTTYDGLLSNIISRFKNPKLLDIGCGRGEWLEKCSHLAIDSIGIEINEKMIKPKIKKI